ncbi:MAG: alpha/beta hydrolase family protein [Cyanobium sp.]
MGSIAVPKEPLLAQGRLFWLEQRPQENGRTTLMGCGMRGEPPRDLTPGPWNLRSRIHGYGGGAYTVDGTIAVFVHDGDRCLWRLDLAAGLEPGQEVLAVGPPRQLTAPWQQGARSFSDGLIDRPRDRWIGVMELGGEDFWVAVPLEGGKPQTLHRPADFCGYPVLSPSATHLAWVEWQQPHMSWERSSLWLGRFDNDGSLVDVRPIAGAVGAAPEAISVFQPLWAGDDLVVANDRSGWWNLEILRSAEHLAIDAEPHWQPLLPLDAEFGAPQWIHGLRTTAWDGQQLIAAACRQGQWELGKVPVGPEPSPGEGDGPAVPAVWHPLALPFDDLAGLCAENGTLVAIASGPTATAGRLEINLHDLSWRHTPATSAIGPRRDQQLPQALWFKGASGRPTHAWFHPPEGGRHPGAPLLVKGHSGPTGMARRGLQLGIQFWTSRGWGVVDVNYGGSTGFGRAYRERLQGLWGVADVADCAAAAEALVAAGRASPERVAIEGGSAGGFTALAALCFTATFQAAACRYAVSDPAALTQHDHRFEARYLDYLIGPWPEAAKRYEARSPLAHAQRISAPVIFFQGLDDTVVPPEQTERMAAALAARAIPVEVHRFAGEGHGFRDGGVQVRVLEASEAFFRRHFQLAPP